MAISRIGEYVNGPATEPTTMWASVGAVLGSMQELVEAFDYPALPALREEVGRCHHLIETGASQQDIESAVTSCTEAGRLATAFILAQRGAERIEATALVTAVREAVVAVAAGNEAFQADVQKSTERFEQMAGIRQALVLQARLRAEVQALKSKIAQAQQASKSGREALARRVAALEVQLSVVRQEGAADPVTGVANRGAFDYACSEWLRSTGLYFSILLVDVDDFKSINDSHGHPEGDRALAAVGAALKKAARSSQDLVARIGGDEFAILARNLPLRAAEGLFARVVAALKEERERATPPLPPITLSGGASEVAAGDTPRSLLQRADEALYEAKRGGKNRVVGRNRPLLRDL